MRTSALVLINIVFLCTKDYVLSNRTEINSVQSRSSDFLWFGLRCKIKELGILLIIPYINVYILEMKPTNQFHVLKEHDM